MEAIPQSGIREIFDLSRGIPGLTHLELGEPDFHMPGHICEAAIRALQNDITKYTPNAGAEELRQVISEKLARENKIDADPRYEILVTTGAMGALALGLTSIVRQNDEVIIPEPCFVNYGPQVMLAGGKPIFVPLQEEEDFRLTPEILENAITTRTRAILLNSPSNPTGAVERLEDLRGIADIALDHDLWVISDESYERITFDGTKHYSIAALPDMFERTLSTFSLSKTYAMTGMRVGYAVSEKVLAGLITKLQEHTVACVNSVAQQAAIAALTGPQTCVDEMVMQYKERRDVLVDGLNKAGLVCRKSPGTFYVFPNIEGTKYNSRLFSDKLIKEAKVVTVPGSVFGKSGEGHIRLSYATQMTNIQMAVEHINEFCSKAT